MCTESSNQQRMWKDLLGETLRAFWARCILFLFVKWKKKILYTSSQLQIWLEAHLEDSVCNCEVLLEINFTKNDEGHKELWHCWLARAVLLDFESSCSICHLSGCARVFRSPCALSIPMGNEGLSALLNQSREFRVCLCSLGPWQKVLKEQDLSRLVHSLFNWKGVTWARHMSGTFLFYHSFLEL